ADEEAQLRWAMEESLQMAEGGRAAGRRLEQQSAEDIQQFYQQSQKKAGAEKEPPSASTFLDSDEEGCAWDSGPEE
ncbi:unnamed protein product, partial [Polarella glacialis]